MAKTKTTQQQTTNESSTATTHTDVPDWIKNPTMQVAGNVQGLIDQGPDAFKPQMGALQNQATQAAGTLTASPYLHAAGGQLNNIQNVGAERVGADAVTAERIKADPWSATTFEASSLLDGGLDRYYNPFKDQITNPVLTDYDVNADKTRAAQAAAAARNKSFQGSRYGIQEAATEGELARGRAATEGGLLSDMFTHSTALAGQDADRRQNAAAANAAAQNLASQSNAQMALQAATSNQGTGLSAAQGNQSANLSAAQGNQNATLSADQSNQQAALQRAQQTAALGQAFGAEDRANIGLQGDLGAQQTAIENAARQYPIQYQAQMESLLSGLNPELYSDKTINSTGTSNMTGSGTSKTKPGLLDIAGSAAQIGAMFLSDRRLKVGVRPVFVDSLGRRWVEFAYRWAPLVRRIGVIAQDVLRTDPLAVQLGPDGYLRVDYGRL